MPVQGLLTEGHAALRVGDTAGARVALERALADAPSGDVIEALARASYIDLDFATAIDAWERAYTAHRQSADHVGAIRVARTLACMYGMVLGDPAVSSGWIARAQTLLAGAADTPERGWVALNLGMFDGDRARKEEYFHEALAAARHYGDTDLEFVTLA